MKSVSILAASLSMNRFWVRCAPASPGVSSPGILQSQIIERRHMVLGYTKSVKELMSVDCVYEGQHEGRISGPVLQKYNDALVDVKRWLRSILMRELSESEYEAARVILYLPLEKLEVRVSAEIDVKFEEVLPWKYKETSCIARQVFEKGTPELISTLIGRMDTYTYNAIIEDTDNPVRLLYQYFISMNDKLHQMIGSSEMLTQDVLKKHKLQDELMLYRMDSILRSVKESSIVG